MKNHLKISCSLLLVVLLMPGLPIPKARASLALGQDDTTQKSLPFVSGRMLVQFRSETTRSQSRRLMQQAGVHDAGEIPGTGVHILELPAGANEEALAHAFNSQAEVEFAELDRIVPPAEIIPNDPWYTNWEWHLRKISAPSAWPMSTGSSSVIIAIIDTGVDATHEDLASKIVPGWNFYDGNSDTRDVRGHGTLVAGTAAAKSNNAVGVASVAWGCQVMPIRVTDTTGYATWSAIANAITWASDHGARVANVSFAASDSSAITSAARYFQDRGGVVTVSAGNESTFYSSSDNPYMMTVSATDSNDVLYSWSNTGNNIDLAAPGFVYTTVRGGGYSSASGTSVSAPIVAGIAALMISANPNLTATQIQDVLKQSADDLGAGGWDTSYGAGRVNASRALSMVSGGGTSDTTPPTVSFTSPTGGATVSGAVSVAVAASDNLGVASVSLKVDGVLFASDTLAPYTFSWNSASSPNGTHTLTSTSTDAAGNSSSVSIFVTVNNAPADATPPTVTVTSPANGATVSGNVSVLVSAADNVAVTRVDLYVDGSLTATSTSSPFTTKWNARKASAGAHVLQCKAYDAAGNSATSASLTVYK